MSLSIYHLHLKPVTQKTLYEKDHSIRIVTGMYYLYH